MQDLESKLTEPTKDQIEERLRELGNLLVEGVERIKKNVMTKQETGEEVLPVDLTVSLGQFIPGARLDSAVLAEIMGRLGIKAEVDDITSLPSSQGRTYETQFPGVMLDVTRVAPTARHDFFSSPILNGAIIFSEEAVPGLAPKQFALQPPSKQLPAG